LGFRPRLCPFALARARPSPVRMQISSRSNSASPPKTVSIKRPCAVVVSAHVSPSDGKPALLGDRRERVQQVTGRSSQPVKPRHHHHVAGVELGQQAAKLRPVGLDAARHFAEHLAGSGRTKLPDLGVNALAVRGDAGIAVNRDMGLCDGAHSALVRGRNGEGVGPLHGSLMQRTYATRKALAYQGWPAVAQVLILHCGKIAGGCPYALRPFRRFGNARVLRARKP
jgi:hypothetical protein